MTADPWQQRLDRLRRHVPLPALAIATTGAFVVPNHPELRHPAVAAALSVVAAVWSLVLIRSTRWRLPAYVVHTAVAGVLVWTSSWYGVFAYTGFLFAYPLGRWRTAGFAVTALVVSASMAGGYPSADLEQTTTYLLVAVVIMALVLNSAMITNRALEQNVQRGQIIDELAETNRRLSAALDENAALHEQLVEQAREAGVRAERQRLAGELHDTVAQGLTGIVTQLEAAEQTRRRPEESARHLAQARDLARASLVDARRSVRALRPEQLEAAALPEALDELARTWSRHSGIAAEVEAVGEWSPGPPAVDAALFRVAQEALANVAKHAGAAKVRLTLTCLDGAVLLDVHDDGSGFVPDGPRDGFGLDGMRERLDAIGGTLTVESAPGYGTTINAAAPT